MNEEIVKAVIKALQKNHRNGPIHARNLASVYENIILENLDSSADKIASLINEEEMKLDEDGDTEEDSEE